MTYPYLSIRLRRSLAELLHFVFPTSCCAFVCSFVHRQKPWRAYESFAFVCSLPIRSLASTVTRCLELQRSHGQRCLSFSVKVFILNLADLESTPVVVALGKWGRKFQVPVHWWKGHGLRNGKGIDQTLIYCSKNCLIATLKNRTVCISLLGVYEKNNLRLCHWNPCRLLSEVRAPVSTPESLSTTKAPGLQRLTWGFCCVCARKQR